jgi:hypothetical protein
LRLSFQLILIVLLVVASFLFQCSSKNDYKHMALAGRLWQFMFGFLAYYVSEFKIGDEESANEEKSKFRQIPYLKNHNFQVLTNQYLLK